MVSNIFADFWEKKKTWSVLTDLLEVFNLNNVSIFIVGYCNPTSDAQIVYIFRDRINYYTS